ncbi:MAG: B12-binding domain-containing radical SAM protein [Candidatus Thorarchaeota archaeon]|jgi:radical SAM superfamily enzyme YgiQ (UPF0313 family)
MTTLLINLSELQSQTASPPIGLYSIKANLKNCTIWDNAIKGDLWTQYINKTFTGSYDIIGISARFSSQHSQMISYTYSCRALASQIHLGGAHAAFAKDFKWTRDKEPDGICLSGHGENYMRMLHGLPTRDFDDLKPPIFTEEDLIPYWSTSKPHDKTYLPIRWIPIEFSRGCGKNCSFCAVTPYWGKLQRHSLEWIEFYLQYLTSKLKISEVLIEDDAFDLKQEWTWSVIELLNKYGIWWSTPNGLPLRPLFNLTKPYWKSLTNRCWRLSLPFETGSPSTARLMNIGSKYLHWDQAQELVLSLREHNIEAAGFFIIGYPGETEASIVSTLTYANSLPLTNRYVYIATPYPGTQLYEYCLDHNYLLEKGEALYEALSYRKALIETPDLSASTLNYYREKAKSYALRARSLK